MDWDSLRQRLDARGIVPAGGSARIYDRSHVADLLA